MLDTKNLLSITSHSLDSMIVAPLHALPRSAAIPWSCTDLAKSFHLKWAGLPLRSGMDSHCVRSWNGAHAGTIDHKHGIWPPAAFAMAVSWKKKQPATVLINRRRRTRMPPEPKEKTNISLNRQSPSEAFHFFSTPVSTAFLQQHLKTLIINPSSQVTFQVAVLQRSK